MHFLEFDPRTDFRLLLAALFLPLAGYLVQIFLGRKLPRQGDWLLTAGMFATMCITVYLFAKSLYAGYHGTPFQHHSGDEAGLTFRWFFWDEAARGVAANVVASLYYDNLGAAMLAVVGVVSFFVHLFSTGYMQGDRRYHIFFANISLFTFAMLGLVLADNILFLFIFWEIMGLMSYLLIGHFSHDPGSPRIRQAAAACKKAFLTTRVGDVCLFVGIMIFYDHFGTFRFTELWAKAAEVTHNGTDWPTWMTVAGLFVFGGTVGKSAQFPLHIWLPDAMEGPTPVSAMIHAATMVAAGVFLLGRTYPLMSPDVLVVVTVVGTVTALFAATIGTTVYDIKGVLAYSTISQLGFMVAAIGLGGVVAGLFHMVTHAFFKACLFLSAGSVIHGCHHEQDMRKMGGLRKHMPVTFACMLVCTLAIAGIPLFSGFYSKDMIVLQAAQNTLSRFTGANLFALVALPLAALLTAFYMFRLIFMTFFGTYRGGGAHHGAHAGHEEHGALAAHGHAAAALHAHDHGHDHGAHDHGAHDPGDHGTHGHAPAHAHAHDDHGSAHAHEEHGHGGHALTPHESPWPMTVSLASLALLGMLGGHFWLADPLHALQFWHAPATWFERAASIPRLYPGVLPAPVVDEHVAHSAHTLAVGVSLSVALLGILIAYMIYGRGWERSQRIAGAVTGALGELYVAIARKYSIDEAVNASVIRGSMLLSRGLSAFDKHVIDGVVNLVGAGGKQLGNFSGWFDRTFVDGLVNGVGALTQGFGSVVRLFQSGRVQQYAAFAVAGGMLAAIWLILL